jgi:superfamily II DNA/RNA helicase
MEEHRTFTDLAVHPDLVAALTEQGITHPFPIQAMTLPVALSGHDIIGQAKTGTGKTLGFGLPILQRVVPPGDAGFARLPAPGRPQALAVTPTRELAVQVAKDLSRAGARRGVRVLTVYGGRAYEPQIAALRAGVEVVVGTPGRLIDLANQRHLDLSQARIVVLDEADEMLDLGFLPDVEKLLAMTPSGRQTMLFSATMPGAVVSLARRYMTQPTHIRAMGEADEGHTVAAVEQFVYRAHAMDKVEMVARIMQAEGRGLTMIFARTKRTAAKVADDLAGRGFAAAAIHGDLGQGAREQAMRAFRSGKVDILVATDVAARGIDVEAVTHVINFQCPEDEKTYLHRIGRTGRAGATGVAITFVDWDDLHRWAVINRLLDLGIPEPEETYSSSPNLYSELTIPEGTRGTLPKSARTRAGLDAEVVEDLGETGRGPGHGRGGRGAGARGSGRGGSPGGGTSHGGTGRGGSGRGGSGRSEAGQSAPRAGGRGSADRGSAGRDQRDGTAPRRQRRRRRGNSGQQSGAPGGE